MKIGDAVTIQAQDGWHRREGIVAAINAGVVRVADAYDENPDSEFREDGFTRQPDGSWLFITGE